MHHPSHTRSPFRDGISAKDTAFVHFEGERDDYEAVGDEQPAREVLEIDWKNGALWAIVGFYLRPIYTQAGQRFKRKEGGAGVVAEELGQGARPVY
ncbi:hypothetical protein EV421DRAFT_1898134 [Armillaria borealis]|uniref:Uncharacterized protein n=1 Tax=Armillaria borealis TaxID=47425 RepID=A0AA39K153_9AGAR|nr:hypothetical protein EV421DRAFT_1898134 [Armillaria borealis]